MRLHIRGLLALTLTAALTAAFTTPPTLAAGQPVVPAGWSSPFSDVGQGDWFYPFVGSLNSQGIINGYDDGRFGPQDATRAGDALIMVLKAAGSGNLAPFPGEHYASGYGNHVVEAGWVDALPPLDGAVTRLLMAQVAAQALDLTPVTGSSPFADVDDGYVTALYQKGLISGSWDKDQLLFKPQDSMTRAEISAIVFQVQDYCTHIHFGSESVAILPDVSVNPYDSAAFVLNGDRMSYTGDDYVASLGIDVSYYQDVIDWGKVANDGIQFAILRCGGRYYQGGGIFEDKQFQNNIKGALDAGLEVGVYFFSQAITVDEAREEANFLLSLIKDYPITGPVVFDWENISNDTARTDDLDRATLTAAANAFCQTVEQAGYQPMVYFNRHIAYLLYNLDGIDQYPFWMAQYSPTPSFYYDFQVWQYSDNGTVDGISTPVDMNIRLLPR